MNRTVFHTTVRQALDIAEPLVGQIWAGEAPSLEIVRRQSVPAIIGRWQDSALNWDDAIRKCRITQQSCFIGVRSGGVVPVLALIRVSGSQLHTNLLFLEKDQGAVPPGLAMTMMDTVLAVVAATFGSERIVLDNPLSALLPYYVQFGYEQMKRLGREAPAMFKSTDVK
ncbi:MAG: hypothetical protein ACN6QT_36605 [Burkholderia contaminans]|uniref:hypothetical protein n=1 Tax=Burkholderia contaminans TaxID=488447 RepID=UPI002D7F9382|nr:hypothetical protein [Burkholderia contaminans]